MSEVLFEITTDHLETGMRGYPVGYCSTSNVDPQKGLFYVGRSIKELAKKSPEEVIFLLYKGKEGSKMEVKAFSDLLAQRSHCSLKTLDAICQLPREGHPMKLFCAALLTCGMIEGKNDYREDAMDLIAKMPQVVATVINYHAGWGATPESRPELGYMENFVHMLNVPNKDSAKLTEVMRLFNVLHYDHGGGNLSTFVGKAVASGLEDMWGSISGAMAALAGPRHGKANQDCLEFVKGVLNEVGESATEEQVEALIRDRLDKGELVYGFGHAVLRVEDTRATVLYGVGEKMYADYPLVKIALMLRKVGPKVLSENPKISNPYPNVDAISGTILSAAGFPYLEYYTVLFGLSRCLGIAMQIVDERSARGGKGTPIVRPKYFYKAKNGA